MSIPSGRRLGPYAVLAPLGAGGMGEVYRARDERLDRDVALKVLPDSFARDPERLARFEREAKLLASLNHPHIAAIYGLEEANGQRFLVLELVEGETLAERVGRGSLPVEEALEVCRQIAEALEAAHEKGVIHRDLKPANVKVTPEGTVKVLDFGLAKALVGEQKGSDPGQSPTLSDIASREGIILGTAAYMSPEQARGKPVDKRADIWAFGCVLYELLTGARAFAADTVTDTLAASLTRDPNWQLLPPNTPLKVHELLRRCLQKDPKRRLHDIADARLEIEEALAGPASAVGMVAPVAIARPARWQQALPWGATALLGIVAAVFAWSAWRAEPSGAKPVAHFVISLPSSEVPAGWPIVNILALSPDGTRLVYVARRGDTTQLYLRRMDDPEPKPIPGTEGGVNPFFSPDGQWVGFSAGGKLKKVSLAGGTPVATICDKGGSAAWGPDDTTVFSGWGGLWRVSAAGGKPEPLAILGGEDAGLTYTLPAFLPGGKDVLVSFSSGSLRETGRIAVLSLETGKKKVLVERGAGGRYLPTGHLVYATAGTLFAAPFDLDRLELTGAPIPLAEGVAERGENDAPQFGVSDSGSLVYLSGESARRRSKVAWVDRNGRLYLLPLPSGVYREASLSPDGRKLVLTISEPTADIWVLDLARGALTRFTRNPGEKETPLWSPDGSRIAYAASARHEVIVAMADGSGAEQALRVSGRHEHVNSWSPDGKFLAVDAVSPTTGWDVWIVPVEGSGKPYVFLETPYTESGAQFSPDGRWLAYFSDESGRGEIYLRPFPGPGAKLQISTEGGGGPRLARNGKELFYRNGKKLMTVPIETTPTLRAGNPRLLAELPGWAYDVAPDGQRFITLVPDEQDEQAAGPVPLHVVLNWSEELKQRVPTTK